VILQAVDQLWTNILAFSATFVTPDWGALIGLLPILLLLFVVGPILTILVLAWAHYLFHRPRTKRVFAATRRAAPLDADGSPVYPSGEPYSPSEGVIYEPGTILSATGEGLVVACPKCGLVRSVLLDTCGNCGLSFTLKPTTRSARPAAAPRGGAAAA
jgi:hypothetical protein